MGTGAWTLRVLCVTLVGIWTVGSLCHPTGDREDVAVRSMCYPRGDPGMVGSLRHPLGDVDSAVSLCHLTGDGGPCVTALGTWTEGSFCPCVIALVCHSLGDGDKDMAGSLQDGTVHTVWFLCLSFGDMDTVGSLCHPLGVSPPSGLGHRPGCVPVSPHWV